MSDLYCYLLALPCAYEHRLATTKREPRKNKAVFSHADASTKEKGDNLIEYYTN